MEVQPSRLRRAAGSIETGTRCAQSLLPLLRPAPPSSSPCSRSRGTPPTPPVARRASGGIRVARRQQNEESARPDVLPLRVVDGPGILTVLLVHKGARHRQGWYRGEARDVNLALELIEFHVDFVVEGGKMENQGERGGVEGDVDVGGDAKLVGCVDGGGGEKVDDEGGGGGGREGGFDVWGVELEASGGVVGDSVGGVERGEVDGWEVVYGDGGGGRGGKEGEGGGEGGGGWHEKDGGRRLKGGGGGGWRIRWWKECGRRPKPGGRPGGDAKLVGCVDDGGGEKVDDEGGGRGGREGGFDVWGVELEAAGSVIGHSVGGVERGEVDGWEVVYGDGVGGRGGEEGEGGGEGGGGWHEKDGDGQAAGS
ncbi:hypothetical protein IEQ34_011628 [Dendrobium chrysotoxum]|uniref:Uncharacterized protein n=1 Tax=Dendrobium chrysotoxum TaxID=161865 RepID=A0AAV7GST5_DENCH|nr:hypothetical protein IEQ34_011628 [Dendrobium chrysotoxum]